MTIRCPFCNQINSNENKFCASCGKEFSQEKSGVDCYKFDNNKVTIDELNSRDINENPLEEIFSSVFSQMPDMPENFYDFNQSSKSYSYSSQQNNDKSSTNQNIQYNSVNQNINVSQSAFINYGDIPDKPFNNDSTEDTNFNNEDSNTYDENKEPTGGYCGISCRHYDTEYFYSDGSISGDSVGDGYE